MPAEYGSLPFTEAYDYLKQKVPVPTRHWADITNDMHGRAFVVAGAAKYEIVSDFHQAIIKVIENGGTITDFRKDFDTIVEKHGWSYNGKRGWRTSTILNTNLSSAYAAGREQQRRAPEILKAFPNDRYYTMLDEQVRKKHREWEGLVLPSDHPFWIHHTPPNDWGCRCYKEPTHEPIVETEHALSDKTIPWENPATGIAEQIPDGVGPGFAYNPADAAWGRPVNKTLIDKSLHGKYTDIHPLTWEEYGRPKQIPRDLTATTPSRKTAETADEMRAALTKAIGGKDALFTDPTGDKTYISQALIDHYLEHPKRLSGRDIYFPYIRELIEDPYEVWISFAREEATGKVLCRKRYIKGIDMGKGKTLRMVCDVQNNMFTALTFFPDRSKAVTSARFGRLLYARKQ